MTETDGGEPPATGMKKLLADTTDRAQDRLDDLRERVPLIDVGLLAVARFRAADGTIVAGYLAFRLFLVLFPLVAIVVALAGFSASGAQEASGHLHLGSTLASSIAEAGADAQQSRLPLLFTGIIGFVVASWGLLGGLQIGAARAWRIPLVKFPAKGRVFLRLCGSLLLFGGVLYLSALVRRLGAVAGAASTLTTFASATVGFFGLSWILPHRCREWFWLLPGAAVGAVGTAGLQAFATFYLPNKLAGASSTYGALGVALAFLGYLYALGVVVVATAVVNAVVHERFLDHPPGLLRRVADALPIKTVRVGSGYVADDEAVEVPTLVGTTDGP